MKRDSKGRAAAKSAAGFLMLTGAGIAIPQAAQAVGDKISAACGHHYVPNVIRIDGDVNFPVSLTPAQIAALPGQQTLNITYLNRLGVAQAHAL